MRTWRKPPHQPREKIGQVRFGFAARCEARLAAPLSGRKVWGFAPDKTFKFVLLS